MKSKIGPLLLSVALALGLWLYVITVEQPESEQTYYDIPVVLQNEEVLAERGLMMVSERPTVTLHLSGTRTNLNKLNESNINVITNMASIVTAGTHELNYNVSFPGNVPSGSITRQSSNPDMVTVKVENRITKQIPVVADYMDTAVPEGLIAKKEELLLDNPLIEVSGPESVMENITQAVIQVDLDGQTQTIVGDYTYTLCDKAGEPVDSKWVTTNLESVNLTLEIHQIKQIQLKLDVISGAGATQTNSDIQLDLKTIFVSGSEAQLAKLDSLVVGEVDLGALTEDSTLTFDIVLPDGVTNETGLTVATATVKFPNLRTVAFDISNIQLLNKPAGMEAQLAALSLKIQLRGPAALMEKITPADVIATVDLSGANVGADKYAVKITMKDGFAGVEAFKPELVVVTLTEIVEEE